MAFKRLFLYSTFAIRNPDNWSMVTAEWKLLCLVYGILYIQRTEEVKAKGRAGWWLKNSLYLSEFDHLWTTTNIEESKAVTTFPEERATDVLAIWIAAWPAFIRPPHLLASNTPGGKASINTHGATDIISCQHPSPRLHIPNQYPGAQANAPQLHLSPTGETRVDTQGDDHLARETCRVTSWQWKLLAVCSSFLGLVWQGSSSLKHFLIG